MPWRGHPETTAVSSRRPPGCSSPNCARECEFASTDIRLYVPKHKLITYPDVFVTCGPDQYPDNRKDTLVDATLIVEVLSRSTKDYDRAEKFRYYRSLPSFAEYLVLAQDEVCAQHWVRQPDGSTSASNYLDASAPTYLLYAPIQSTAISCCAVARSSLPEQTS